MKKYIIILITIFAIIFITNSSKVYAEESLGLSNNYNTKTNEVIKNYLFNLNTGNKKVYDYIDQNNKQLKKNTKKYLGRVLVQYIIDDIKEDEDGKITANITISATAKNKKSWKIYGVPAQFILDKDTNGNLKIVETDIFKNFFLDDITRIFKLIILSIIIIVAVIVIIINKSKKKNINNNYYPNIQYNPNLNNNNYNQ
jgi:hypothetical protein